MEVKIRDVDPVIVKKIDEMAKRKNMSRNSFLKHCLSRFAIVQDVTDLDQKYSALVDILSDRLQQENDVIAANTEILETIAGGHL